MNPDDYAYFRRRTAQEDEASRSALCEEARICHRDLAAAYRVRCTRIFDGIGRSSDSEKPSTPVAICLATNSGGPPEPVREGARCEIRL